MSDYAPVFIAPIQIRRIFSSHRAPQGGEGQNIMVEYHWLEGQFDRLPALMADLVRRRIVVIATPAGNAAALAAKAATTTIPVVFGVGQDRLSSVSSPASPGLAET